MGAWWPWDTRLARWTLYTGEKVKEIYQYEHTANVNFYLLLYLSVKSGVPD